VVGNNNIKPLSLRLLDLSQSSDAAINGDNQADTLLVELLQNGCLDTVPFIQTMREIGDDLAAEPANLAMFSPESRAR